MKTQVAAAVALALAGVAGTASAATFQPWDVQGSETTLKLGGATAQDKGIILLMRRLCSTGTMARVQGTKDSAIMCEANGIDTGTFAAGTKLVLYKNSTGGSGTGVLPVANSTTIAFPNLASLAQADYQNPAKCTVTSVASTADFADYTNYACGTSLGSSNLVPDAGVSDVEPALLGWTAASGPLTTSPAAQQIFGVPVSKNFRNALQTAQQGKLGAACIGSSTEACMPSLTKAQLTAIWTGGIIQTAKLSKDDGTVLTGSTALNICRRAAGSGTLASFKAYFTGEGCVNNAKPMVSGTAQSNTATARVNEYTGTAGVIGCLNSMNTQGKFAIGMASMEFAPGGAYANTGLGGDFETDAGNWGWIKINGYAPTLLNVVQTKYDFMMEPTYQVRTGFSGPSKSLFDLVVSTNSASAVVKELDNAFSQSGFDTGLLGVPGVSVLPSAAPAGVLTAAEVKANPVNSWTRAASGSGNSCQLPYIKNNETGLDYSSGF